MDVLISIITILPEDVINLTPSGGGLDARKSVSASMVAVVMGSLVNVGWLLKIILN